MTPTLDDIFYSVLEAFDIDDETYRNIKDTRETLATSIRQVICWIGQNTYGYSQNNIGQYLGLDHSTVWYNKKKADDYMSYDKSYRMCVDKALSIICAKEDEQKECSIIGYIARDKDGDLTVFSNRPTRDTFSDGMSFWCGEEPRELNPSNFPQVTYESEPVECEITLRLK